MEDRQDIWEVIVRYLDDTSSEGDSQRLRQWLDEDEENRSILHSFKRIWSVSDASRQSAFLEDLNLEEDWDIIKAKMDESKPAAKKNRSGSIQTIRRKQSFMSVLLKVAAVVLVAAVSVVLTLQYTSFKDAEYEPVFRVISTNAGERANVDLGDGTRVTLNAESRIEVPDVFTNTERYVKVSGQAFFDVAPDETRPFFVETEHITVQVIGTAFDVRSYSNEASMHVAVREGTVELKNNSGPAQTMLVNKGQLGWIDIDEGQIELGNIEDMDFYTGWLDGRLIFKSSPFDEALNQIRRWFNVEIDLNLSDTSILEKEFTADLKMRSIESVFNAIAISMNLEYRMDEDGERITIKN